MGGIKFNAKTYGNFEWFLLGCFGWWLLHPGKLNSEFTPEEWWFGRRVFGVLAYVFSGATCRVNSFFWGCLFVSPASCPSFNLFHTPGQRPTFAGGDGHEMLLKSSLPWNATVTSWKRFFSTKRCVSLREKLVEKGWWKRQGLQEKLGVSKYRGTPKWMVYNMEHQIKNGWFRVTIIFGNIQLDSVLDILKKQNKKKCEWKL